MDGLKPVDLILARRTRLNNSETFDLLVHEDHYYRIILTNYFKDNKVILTTNINDFSTEPIFEYSSDNEVLDALFVQAKFVFESFIEQEYINNDEDFDVEVNVIDVEEACQKIDVSRDALTKFIEQNNLDEILGAEGEVLDEDSHILEQLEKYGDDFNDCSNILDELFIDESILDEIAKKYYKNMEMN